MILTDSEIQLALADAQAAFPNFKNWEYVNDPEDDDYFGFSMWGEFVANPGEMMPRCFFVTLNTHQNVWRGNLTIGQHSYLWSSADFGDAHLINTQACLSLEEAIAALQQEITTLFHIFMPPELLNDVSANNRPHQLSLDLDELL